MPEEKKKRQGGAPWWAWWVTIVGFLLVVGLIWWVIGMANQGRRGFDIPPGVNNTTEDGNVAANSAGVPQPVDPADAPAANIPANVVKVNLTEFVIAMPERVPVGLTTFRVSNVGSGEHNFEIEGEGIEERFETNLSPGETRDLEVDLKPGTYKVYCPVGDHEAKGMVTELTVN